MAKGYKELAPKGVAAGSEPTIMHTEECELTRPDSATTPPLHQRTSGNACQVKVSRTTMGSPRRASALLRRAVAQPRLRELPTNLTVGDAR